MRVQNRFDLAAFPSPSLPRRCNSSLSTATNRLATHRSTLRAPVTCRGTRQSVAEGHRAAAAAMTRRRRRSVGPTPHASAGPGGGPTMNSGRRRSSTGGRRAQTKAAPPRISRIGFGRVLLARVPRDDGDRCAHSSSDASSRGEDRARGLCRLGGVPPHPRADRGEQPPRSRTGGEVEEGGQSAGAPH
jgi:hypothetical protein